MKRIKPMLPCEGEKGRFSKFGPQKKRRNMDKIRCYGLGYYKKDCPNKDKRKKEEAHVTREIEEPNSKKPKKEEVKDLYYD